MTVFYHLPKAYTILLETREKCADDLHSLPALRGSLCAWLVYGCADPRINIYGYLNALLECADNYPTVSQSCMY